jgi:hypothetical protein
MNCRAALRGRLYVELFLQIGTREGAATEGCPTVCVEIDIEFEVYVAGPA